MTKFGTPLLNIVLRSILTLAFASFSFLFALHFKTRTDQSKPTSHSTEELYLPDITGLKLLSIGYNQALSHILWFRTINYFGKELRGTKNYQYLSHYLNLVITLNPKLEHVYEFGVMMLSWETNQPKDALKLLDKAIIEYPQSWYFRYLRGFTYLYFLNDPVNAKEDYKIAATLPDTPESIRNLASEDFGKISSKFSAMRMLRGLIATAPDLQTKNILEQKLIELMKSNSEKLK